MKAQNFTPDEWLKHGDTITFGKQIMEIKHCPGHAPGHVIGINHKAKKILLEMFYLMEVLEEQIYHKAIIKI